MICFAMTRTQNQPLNFNFYGCAGKNSDHNIFYPQPDFVKSIICNNFVCIALLQNTNKTELDQKDVLISA